MKSYKQKMSEDAQQATPPTQKEVAFDGYHTKNLHHSEDAAKSFKKTIDRFNKGQIKDRESILLALKATDTYMQINNMRAQQGTGPSADELASWRAAHNEARMRLNKIGEFFHHLDYWHNMEHEMQDAHTSHTDPTGDVEITEELTNKTIRAGDKVKVARVIADMLGVENAESLSPETAISTGLRKVKNRRMTPEMVGILKKMLNLAQEVGVKVDAALIPKAVSEGTIVSTGSNYNIANDILRYKDFEKLKQMNSGDKVGKIGHSMHGDDDSSVRRMKVKYKTEGEERQASADYKTDKTGRKHPAHELVFKTNEAVDEPSDGFEDLSDDELETMAGGVDHEDHILDLYDDEELAVIDADTGEEEKEDGVNEEALNEVLSRIERMKAKIRFARTQAKRTRRMQIALKRRSDNKTINRRARKLAINMMKQRIMKKAPSELSIGEKERVERIIQSRRGLIDRLAMRLAPRVRKIETDRLSHKSYTK